MPILLVCAAFQTIKAQEHPVLTGQIIAADSGTPLAGASVLLNGGTFLAITDGEGHFHFAGVPSGQYDLEIRHVGYESVHLHHLDLSVLSLKALEIRAKAKPIRLPDISVSVERVPMGGIQSGARIISQEQLRKMQPQNMADALQRVGLIEIISDGSPGGAQSLSLRGSASDQVLVLLDGRPMNNPSSGLADLSQISLAEVERIEIYSSPNSILGAQAIGGVVNVVTQRPGMPSTEIQAGGSNFGERKASVQINRALGRWPFLAMLEHDESDGRYNYQVVPDDGLETYTRHVGQQLTRENAAYRREFLTLKLDPPGLVEMGYRQTMLNRENPDYLPLPELAHDASTEDMRQEITLNLEGRSAWYHPAVHLKAEAYQQRTLMDYGENYPLLREESDLRGEAYGGEASWNSRVGWQNVTYGIGERFERVWSSDLNKDCAERLHKFAYVQAQGRPFEKADLPLDLGIVGGVRADFYSGEDAFLHPRLGMEIGKEGAPAWALRAEIASAYHLPSFNALFWQEDLQSAGNPNLKPEHSSNRELAAEIRSAAWDLNMAFFDRQVSDLIYWRFDFDNKWKPLNLAGARIRGIELNLHGVLGSGLGRTEWTILHRWMQAINESRESNTNGLWLAYRPERTLTMWLDQDLNIFRWDVAFRWVSRRFTNEANTKSLSPYAVWDAGISRSFEFKKGPATLDLRLEARNLLNAGYRIVEAAPMPLREWWLSVRFQMKGLHG